MSAGSIVSLLFFRNRRISQFAGSLFLFAGLAAAAVPVFSGFGKDPCFFFRLPILILGTAGGLHSLGYLKGHGEERAGLYWCFYNLTIAAMLGVMNSSTPLLFLVMWELMGLFSFVLTAFDYRSSETLRAGWIYLLSCQLGGMILMLLFLFSWSPLAAFVLAVLGFGLKAGFPLLHVWLPEAHPAAPAPVSALMSGGMIQLGFYGIMRWGMVPGSGLGMTYGFTLLILGMIGSLGGILYALPRRNLKTALAYSSIENMGIIAMGFGFGFLGESCGSGAVAFCGFGGAFLHMCNHSLLKGGLFLGAGSVQRAAGTLNMDIMGGLLKRMPLTGSVFILNSIGICGLPPFNAFASEILIYCAGLTALGMKFSPALSVVSLCAVTVLALCGGLAAAVFAKVCGAVFLGLPRSEAAAAAEERPRTMTVPVLLLFILSMGVALCSGVFLEYGLSFAGEPAGASAALPLLRTVSIFSVLSVILFALLLVFRFRLLPRGREIRRVGTWDCGYAAPDPRMEYTGTAFSQPITDFLRCIMCRKRIIKGPEGIFPKEMSYEEDSADPGLSGFWGKIFEAAAHLAEKVHTVQSGYLHLYILIMTAALILMVIWGLILPWSGTILK